MTIGTFTVIKNEVEFVGYCIMSVLPYVDEMVFADGNSTDGTLELIKYIKKTYDKQDKIKLFENKDCKNLKEDYVRLFNWTLNQCTTDYVWFLHPDMIVVNPKSIKIDYTHLRYNVNMASIAGENRDLIITQGRTGKWATIYKNDLGLHYHGHYGSVHEDLYFGEITGDEHILYSLKDFIPYTILDTDIKIYHYCDTKPYERRLGRMKACLRNIYPYMIEPNIDLHSIRHPRVTLTDGIWNESAKFAFQKHNLPEPIVFKKYRDFKKFIKVKK